MWPNTFALRLQSWSTLRHRCQDLDTKSALEAINAWWFQSPWCAYYLHWDDKQTWPDPWQLLSDNVFCDVARGLGIMYTIAMLEREDLEDSCLIDNGEYNLVLVQQEKYILNWDQSSIVNINLGPIQPRRSVSQHQILAQLK